MLSKGSHSIQTQPESGAVVQPQEASFGISSNWRWVLYATAGVALVLALKYIHVQDWLKSALDWIGQLGPWGPVIFVGLYVVATVFVTRLARRALAKKIGSNKTEQNPRVMMSVPLAPVLVKLADAHNARLVSYVHPPDWQNPTPASCVG